MKITSKIFYSNKDFIIGALCMLGVGVGIASFTFPIIKSNIRIKAFEDLLKAVDPNAIVEKDGSVTFTIY